MAVYNLLQGQTNKVYRRSNKELNSSAYSDCFAAPELRPHIAATKSKGGRGEREVRSGIRDGVWEGRRRERSSPISARNERGERRLFESCACLWVTRVDSHCSHVTFQPPPPPFQRTRLLGLCWQVGAHLRHPLSACNKRVRVLRGNIIFPAAEAERLNVAAASRLYRSPYLLITSDSLMSPLPTPLFLAKLS